MMQKALQRNVKQKGLKESICGSTAGSDMLGWIKLLALDPCEPDVSRDSVQKFWYQALQLRKVWHISNAKCSQVSSELSLFTFYQLIMLVRREKIVNKMLFLSVRSDFYCDCGSTVNCRTLAYILQKLKSLPVVLCL